jgi:hypothetical protein
VHCAEIFLFLSLLKRRKKKTTCVHNKVNNLLQQEPAIVTIDFFKKINKIERD